MTATLLNERHTRIFWDGSSLRTTITKHVPSFAPVAQHHLFLLDTTMERNFPWLYHQISSRGEDFNLLFIVSNSSIKFMSAFKHRHSFSKLGESKSLHFWKDQLSGNSNIFQSRQNSIGFLYQQVSLSPFWVKDQNKLWRRNFVQSTYVGHSLRL